MVGVIVALGIVVAAVAAGCSAPAEAPKAYGVWRVVEKVADGKTVAVPSANALFIELTEKTIMYYMIVDGKSAESKTEKINWVVRDGKLYARDSKGEERLITFVDENTILVEDPAAKASLKATRSSSEALEATKEVEKR